MISEKIQNDIEDEFANFKNDLQAYLPPSFNVSQTKQFLKTHIPREIIYKIEIILDTLLNYLMEDARSKIQTADVSFQNAFYDADFRSRIREWTNQLENKFELDSDILNFTSDPQLKQGLIVSSIIAFAGVGTTLTLTSNVVGVIISGIVTIVLSVLSFKIAYDKASPQARDLVKQDIDQHLETSQKQIIEWTKKVIEAFENYFYDFCLNNGFELKQS